MEAGGLKKRPRSHTTDADRSFPSSPSPHQVWVLSRKSTHVWALWRGGDVSSALSLSEEGATQISFTDGMHPDDSSLALRVLASPPWQPSSQTPSHEQQCSPKISRSSGDVSKSDSLMRLASYRRSSASHDSSQAWLHYECVGWLEASDYLVLSERAVPAERIGTGRSSLVPVFASLRSRPAGAWGEGPNAVRDDAAGGVGITVVVQPREALLRASEGERIIMLRCLVATSRLFGQRAVDWLGPLLLRPPEPVRGINLNYSQGLGAAALSSLLAVDRTPAAPTPTPVEAAAPGPAAASPSSARLPAVSHSARFIVPLCSFYGTPFGCQAGIGCRFRHGNHVKDRNDPRPQLLPPPDPAVTRVPAPARPPPLSPSSCVDVLTVLEISFSGLQDGAMAPLAEALMCPECGLRVVGLSGKSSGALCAA